MHDTSTVVTRSRVVSATARQLGSAALIAVGYYLGATVGFSLTLAPIPVSTLWPPNAILLAGLLLTPRRSWPTVLGAVFLAHLASQVQSGVPLAMILCWFVSNCTEALIGAWLLQRVLGGAPTFETFKSTALFFVCAGVTGPFLSSFLDGAFVVANGFGEGSYWEIWRTRFFSNVLATITLVPAIVMTVERVRHGWVPSWRRAIEVALGLGALATVCWIVFVVQEPGPGMSPALLYTPVPLLVAAAVRFGPMGASGSLLVCAFLAIIGAILGQGPFVSSSAARNALSIQLFLIVAWIPIMALAAVVRERAHADAKARWSEEQLAMTIDAAQLGRWEWDVVHQRLLWSDITRAMYEVPPDAEVTPEIIDARVHPDDRSLLAAATADCLERGTVDVEFRLLFPDGRVKWIHSMGRTTFDATGAPSRMIGVKVDVTARKTAEAQLQERQRQLAQLSRVAVAGEMSIALAHELNQPLAAILANASAARRFLLHNPPDLRELAEIVDNIADDNRRAAAIITRFHTLSKTANATRTKLDVNDVIASVVDLVRGDVVSRGVRLSTSATARLPPVLGDVVQLQQVLLNLIVNACDAMDSQPVDTRRLVVTTSADGGDGVRVTVSDAGPGVGEDRLPHIFEPFVTSKAQRLGLGLAICSSIVSAHDGRLWAENQPGGGAVFHVVLPGAAREPLPESQPRVHLQR